jgi:hypothetical protein
LLSFGGAVEAVEDPFEDTAVFVVARPHEVALLVAAEPVDRKVRGTSLPSFAALEERQFFTNNT